jgi:putative redox protein
MGHMRATARRKPPAKFQHDVRVRDHLLTSDEPQDTGGDDTGPSPQELLAASLASCTAITLEMYAARKGWDLGDLEVVVDLEYGQGGVPSSFLVTIKLPQELSEEQQERLKVIAGKCPVHRVLACERPVEVTDQIELA